MVQLTDNLSKVAQKGNQFKSCSLFFYFLKLTKYVISNIGIAFDN